MQRVNSGCRYVLAALALCCASGAHSSEQQHSSDAVMLQGFHWHSHQTNWYNSMQANASSIKQLGVSHVWFPPVSDAAAPQGYLPRQLNNLNSAYGSAAQLQAATAALAQQGVKSVADIVVNHRVGSTNWADFTNPSWGPWAVTRDDEWGQGSGNWDSGDGYHAARDLDHSNVTVQADIISWINNVLKPAGFSGIRFDYSKGYSAYYAGLYARATGADFCVGEVWTDLNYDNVDGHRQQIEMLALPEFAHLFGVFGNENVESLLGQIPAQQIAQARIIVDDEDLSGGGGVLRIHGRKCNSDKNRGQSAFHNVLHIAHNG